MEFIDCKNWCYIVGGDISCRWEIIFIECINNLTKGRLMKDKLSTSNDDRKII